MTKCKICGQESDMPFHTCAGETPKPSTLEILHTKLLERAEWWRTNESDSHGINTAVYVAMRETAGVIEEVIKTIPNPDWVTPIKAGKFKKPTLADVHEAVAKMDMPSTEADKFWNFYESKGWKVGRNAMKSWTSALANWKKGWEEKQVATRPTQLATVWELKSVMTAKELAAKSLRDKYAAEVSTGWLWNNEERRQEYIKLRIEIKRLNEQIARMG